MNNNSILSITDRKGVVVGTWKRGETFLLRCGDHIKLNNMGVASYNGKLLNLPMAVREALIKHGRIAMR